MYKFKMKSDVSMEHRIPTMQTWILIQSQIYYNGTSRTLVSDKHYDEVSYELRDLIKQYPEDAAKSRFAYAFHDFDGTTGFDLFNRLEFEESSYVTRRLSHIFKNESKKKQPKIEV